MSNQMFEVKITWCEGHIMPIKNYVGTKEIKELNSLTYRKCLNYPSERGYDKVGFEILYNGENFYTGKYYVKNNGHTLLEHIKDFLPEIAPTDEIIPQIIDMVFGEIEIDEEMVRKYFADDEKGEDENDK